MEISEAKVCKRLHRTLFASCPREKNEREINAVDFRYGLHVPSRTALRMNHLPFVRNKPDASGL
jgi:hypothetical protein